MHAYETQLDFSGKKGHAVVVDCDQPWRFVFWDKAQYVGCVDVGEGVWFTPEWCETNSPGGHDLTVWVQGRFAQSAEFAFLA